MKYLLLFFAVLLPACGAVTDLNNFGCTRPNYNDYQMAKWLYYNASKVEAVSLHKGRVSQMFGCNYQQGDQIYHYSNFWDSGYILVRGQSVITYYKK